MILIIIMILSMHQNLEEITLINEGRLLEEYEEIDLEKYYPNLESKFFGWSSHIIQEDMDVVFISETLFSYSNQSNETITYKYTYSSDVDISDSIAVTGDISTSAKTKVKIFDLKFDSSIKSRMDYKSSESISEKWNLDIDIPPFKKISLKIKGEGKVSNGVSRLYIFYIPIKKGGWEVLDVTKTYYWLEEEYV